ncbi:unnamed protein product [Rotaria sordida]|uniref:LTD domain-containing protein n=1 Tax=Rotaria sordida TaxID=392033 RepID=A0A813QAX1_9BILA|nr:unnamed protein product [Rotaria sordida]
MVNNNSIKRLIYFVNNFEEKLSSIKLINDKLYELMSIVSKTHEDIIQELSFVKTILNQTIIEQEEDEIIPIDGTKSEWDDDDDDDDTLDEFQSEKINKNIHRENNPLIRRTDRILINSASSNDSSSIIENYSNYPTIKRSSNMKKSDRSSSRTKSPKAVTFSLDENLHNQQQTSIQPNQQLHNDTKNETFDEITTPIIPYSYSNSSKENQSELKAKIENIITNIRIHEIESKNGDYIRLLNLSNSDDYDLSGHYLQQIIASKPICRFRFPSNTIIRAGHTVTVWCGHFKDITPQPPYVFLWKEQPKWQTGPLCLTILAKPNGQPIALFRNCSHIDPDQSSSDILFLRSKSTTGSTDISNNSSISIKRQSRYSLFNSNVNNKPPFAHSPNNPIHPDHNGTNVNMPNDLRCQTNQKVSAGVSRLLNRPKSSPFASHLGCKQDLISRNILQTQQTQRHKQTTVKT